MFERKKKDAGDIAGEKASTAKKLAEDQVKKTTDAISGATSGAQGLVGGLTDDAKSGAKDVQKKAGKLSFKCRVKALSNSRLIRRQSRQHRSIN